MIHFDVVNDNSFGEIMQEFGAFVEEGSIVFISLQYAVVGIREVAAAP